MESTSRHYRGSSRKVEDQNIISFFQKVLKAWDKEDREEFYQLVRGNLVELSFKEIGAFKAPLHWETRQDYPIFKIWYEGNLYHCEIEIDQTEVSVYIIENLDFIPDGD